MFRARSIKPLEGGRPVCGGRGPYDMQTRHRRADVRLCDHSSRIFGSAV